MSGRVQIDVGGNPLVETPTWADFDELPTCRCSGFEITTGRQSEFDTTDTGTATVYFNDRDGTLNDPDLVGSPIQLNVQDPTTGTFETQYRGTIDDVTYDVNPNAFVSNVQLQCKDLFDYLAQTEMIVGVFGQVSTTGAVLYEDQRVDERIEDLLTDAQVADALSVVFSGNVNVWDAFYDSGDSVLVALRDAADAEFPGIANLYVDRFGRICFHGRFARFDPDTVSASASNWDFQRWAAATRGDVTSGVGQIRRFSYNRPRSRIVNAAIAWPRYNHDGSIFKESQKANQVRTDATSISRYGYRAKPPMGDLLIADNFNNDNTGAEECQLFADFYVNNYSTPRTNIQTVTFKSMRPDHPSASDTWGLLLRADISDIIALTVGEAGLSAEDYYIEGFHKIVRTLDGPVGFDMVETTPNLTPFAYYTDNVFEA